MLARVPLWLPYLPLNRWRDTEDSGSSLQLRWRAGPGEHFDLTRYNGEVDSYMPCTDRELCYLNGYKNTKGDRLILDRDSTRRLTSLIGPHNNSLRFTYDPQLEMKGRITQIDDSHGRRVLYRYSPYGQLQSVTYPSGETLGYVYDKTHNLISISVASTALAPPQVLITNVYKSGKLVSQTLADGSVYAYSFPLSEEQEVDTATVRLPNGTTYDLRFDSEGAVVTQRPNLLSPNRKTP